MLSIAVSNRGIAALVLGSVCLAAVALGGCARGVARPAPDPAALGRGEGACLVGEVTPHTAILWARCIDADEILVQLDPGPEGGLRATIDRERDHTARLPLLDLEPDTAYSYSIHCGESAPGGGTFQTPPLPGQAEAVRFAWFGDIGGQNVCRDRDHGYHPFAAVRAEDADFFVALGDMVYVDDPCLEVGRYGNAQSPGPPAPARELEDFHAHWRYGRADRPLQRAFSGAAVYAIWDDHEIRNDAGPAHDTLPDRPWQHLMPAARQAFLDYNPMPAIDGSPRLHRSVRWGRHLELFLLDTRGERDANDAADRDGKSMLGEEQKAWLLDGLRASDATWKVIVSSVPISVPTGTAEARDGWADHGSGLGFESELREILTVLQGLERRDVVWITTDVHFGAAIRYTPFADDPEFVFHEIITGPLNAGVFPQREMDPTFHPERLYFHGPEAAEDITSYEDALRWFNFGVIDVGEDSDLRAEIVDANGATAFELRLRPWPEDSQDRP
jgi:alkaline phosphatase D